MRNWTYTEGYKFVHTFTCKLDVKIPSTFAF